MKGIRIGRKYMLKTEQRKYHSYCDNKCDMISKGCIFGKLFLSKRTHKMNCKRD
jgi:hypothetical protein